MFALTDEERMWQSTLRSFLDRHAPIEYVRQCDQERRWPEEAWRAAADSGWLGLAVPAEDGGLAAPGLMTTVFAETMAARGVAFAEVFTVPMFTASLLVHNGTPAQKEAWLPPFLEGRIKFCISITEPDAGSDAASLQLNATRQGSDYHLNGQKVFTSGAHVPGTVLVVAARTGDRASRQDGISLFLVPNDSAGLDIRPLPTLSRRIFSTNEVFFTDVKVPYDQLLGRPNEGWAPLLEHLERERVSVAASYVGAAQEALDTTIRYIRQRQQFGVSISRFQAVRHLVADLQTQLDAARLLVYRAATGSPGTASHARETAMAKLYASEVSVRVSREAMVLHGGYGQLPEYDVERHYREAIQNLIGGGTPQIQRSVIAKAMGL